MIIRKATIKDLSRIAEIFVFNNRVNYRPIFKDDGYSFGELQVVTMIDNYFGKEEVLKNLIVYHDGLIKGFVEMKGTEICKIYVDTFFQSEGIGKELIIFVINEYQASHLWALEKNDKAISFYKKHGFNITGEKKFEEDTDEYLVRLIR